MSDFVIYIGTFIAFCMVMLIAYITFVDDLDLKPIVSSVTSALTDEERKNAELQEVKTLVSEKTGIGESEIIVKFNSHRKYDVFVGNESYLVRTNRDNNAIKTFFKKRKK